VVVTALLHMLRAGCPWRDLPCAGVHWRTVYGYFVRWRDNGVWSVVLAALGRQQEGRLRFVDSTYVRVNQSAANPVGGPAPQAIGPSRGGRTTKVHALVDGRGRALKLLLTAGNVVDITVAEELTAGLDESTCGVLVADKGYDSDALRHSLQRRSIFPCLSLHPRRLTSRPFHRGYYRHRHRIENFFCALKRHRRVATRYDKLASSFLAFVALSAILHWIG
jgi:transposase